MARMQKGKTQTLPYSLAFLLLSFLWFWFLSPSCVFCCFCFVLSCFSLLFFPSCVSCCCCFVSYYVCHFLWFGLSLLHAISAADTFYYSFFLSTVFLHIRFNFYPFIQKDLGLCGPNNLYWIKRVLDPICLNLPNSLCRRFVFCCRSLFLAFLSQPRCKSILFFFFFGFFRLLFLFFLRLKERNHISLICYTKRNSTHKRKKW